MRIKPGPILEFWSIAAGMRLSNLLSTHFENHVRTRGSGYYHSGAVPIKSGSENCRAWPSSARYRRTSYQNASISVGERS
jgi:hypothetical protein